MDETLQLMIVIVVIAISSAYSIWRIHKSLKNKGGACEGCPLKDACNKGKDIKTINNDCKHRK